MAKNFLPNKVRGHELLLFARHLIESNFRVTKGPEVQYGSRDRSSQDSANTEISNNKISL